MENLKKIGWFFGYWAAIVVGLAAITSLTRFVANGFSASPFGLSGIAGVVFLIEGLLGALFLVCRSTFVRVLLGFLMIMVLWAALGRPNVAEAAEATTPCVPFAVKSVPDETQPRSVWELAEIYNLFIGATDEKVGVVRYYEKESGLTLGVYELYGQTAFKAWACSKADPKTDNKPDHMVAIPDGKGGWHARNIQKPQWFDILSHDGTLAGVSLVLQEKAEVGAPVHVIIKPEK